MLTSEDVQEIEAVMDDPAKRWAMSPGAAITYIEALLEDRAELVAENERLREQTQQWVKDWEVECQRYEAALGIATSEHVALKAEIERLRAVVEAAREGCDTCHKYNGDDYWIERNFKLEAVARAAKQVDRLCGWPANPDPGFAEAKALGTLRKALKALEGEGAGPC